MPILRPDNHAAQQGPQHLGFVILRQDPGRLSPMCDDKGALAIFATAQVAVDAAKGVAEQELRPNGDQKIVTPQMKSHQYLVAAVAVVAQMQAEIKNPGQLLAGKDVKVN